MCCVVSGFVCIKIHNKLCNVFPLQVDFEASIAENRFIVKTNVNPVIDESEWYPMAFLLFKANVNHALIAIATTNNLRLTL